METLLLIPDIICTFGFGVIEENLDSLLDAMANKRPDFAIGALMHYAKIIGLCIALGVGANECYQMILGRRGMDVMKILHIVIISMCISLAGTIANMAKAPGMALEKLAKSNLMGINEQIAEQEMEVVTLQQQYLNDVRNKMAKLEKAREEETAQNTSWANPFEKIAALMSDEFAHYENVLKNAALTTETKICEWLSTALRFLAQVFFQAVIYALLVCQRVILAILAAFAPINFAISLSPHYKAAWSQWLSKYITVSLWGFVTYIMLFYAFFIISYNLTEDIAAYNKLTHDLQSTDGFGVASIGMQALGSTCMYIVGILCGIKMLSFVPEVASWLIPGGVSSGAGSMATGMATAGASMAAGAAIGTVGAVAGGAGAAAGGTSTAAKYVSKVVGTSQTNGQGYISAIAANTGIGRSYNEGRKNGRETSIINDSQNS